MRRFNFFWLLLLSIILETFGKDYYNRYALAISTVNASKFSSNQLRQGVASSTRYGFDIPKFKTRKVLRKRKLKVKKFKGATTISPPRPEPPGLESLIKEHKKKQHYVQAPLVKLFKGFTSQSIPGISGLQGTQEMRNPRFLSLFTVVRFSNEQCPTTHGKNGTCYTSNDCTAREGTGQGSCASGFGVCCFFEFECGKSTAENGTYFVNPSSSQRVCNLMIDRLNDDICQIRLELDTFEISSPNADGECEIDFFLVTGGSEVPQICGLNSGQHLVYSITSNSGPSQLSMVLDTTATVTTSRNWKIRVYQYECSSRSLAPVGCLQYYTSASGVIKSFNYRSEVTDTNANHLANLNYAVCVRVENGYCGIKYAQVASDAASFTLTGQAAATMTAVAVADVSVGDVACSLDYVIIPNGSGDGALGIGAKDRYCGKALGRCNEGSVTCVVGLGSVAYDNETNDAANRGFYLTYNQLPCLGRIQIG